MHDVNAQARKIQTASSSHGLQLCKFRAHPQHRKTLAILQLLWIGDADSPYRVVLLGAENAGTERGRSGDGAGTEWGRSGDGVGTDLFVSQRAHRIEPRR